MSLPRFIQKQLASPAGWLGRLVLKRLNKANRGMNELSLGLLPVSSGDTVLEIGFGGGDLLDRILCEEPASVVGVEKSELSADVVRTLHRQTIEQGVLKLLAADAASMPFENERFSKIYCVNVIYFWPEPDRVFREISRVTAASGRFALCYQEYGPERSVRFNPLQIERSLIDAGFASARTTSSQDRWNGLYFCTIANKPEGADPDFVMD